MNLTVYLQQKLDVLKDKYMNAMEYLLGEMTHIEGERIDKLIKTLDELEYKLTAVETEFNRVKQQLQDLKMVLADASDYTNFILTLKTDSNPYSMIDSMLHGVWEDLGHILKEAQLPIQHQVLYQAQLIDIANDAPFTLSGSVKIQSQIL